MERRNKRMKALAQVDPMNLSDIHPEDDLTIIEPNLNVDQQVEDGGVQRVLSKEDIAKANDQELAIWSKYYGDNDLKFTDDEAEVLFLERTSGDASPTDPWDESRIRASRKNRMKALSSIKKKADFYDDDLYDEEEIEQYRKNPNDALIALKAMVRDKVFFEDLDPVEQVLIKSTLKDMKQNMSGSWPGVDTKWPEIVDKYPQFLPQNNTREDTEVKELDPWADTKIRARRNIRMQKLAKINASKK